MADHLDSKDLSENTFSQESYLRDINDPEGIRCCYAKYGVVGITGILTKSELRDTVDEFQRILINLGIDKKFNIRDSSTYDLVSTQCNRYGVIGKSALITEILNRNRFHPNVKKAYSIVYETDPKNLIAQYDRLGWMRPTISPNGESWLKFNTPYVAPGLHLDVDPVYYFDPLKHNEVSEWLNRIPYTDASHLVNENNVKNIQMGTHCQGVLNILDNDDGDGGFQFIPGGHTLMKRWFNENMQIFGTGEPNGRYFFKKTDRLFLDPVRLPCPGGTLIIFDCALPHGTRPNHSNTNRMIQFLRYMPRDVFDKKTLEKRKKLISDLCDKSNFKLAESEVV